MEYISVSGYDKEQPVAYIFENFKGVCVVIKCDEGWLCMYNGDTPNVWKSFNEDEFKIIKKFYPGDKITITF